MFPPPQSLLHRFHRPPNRGEIPKRQRPSEQSGIPIQTADTSPASTSSRTRIFLMPIPRLAIGHGMKTMADLRVSGNGAIRPPAVEFGAIRTGYLSARPIFPGGTVLVGAKEACGPTRVVLTSSPSGSKMSQRMVLFERN